MTIPQPTFIAEWSRTTNPLDPPVWQTMTGLKSFTTNRATNYELDQTQPGTLTALFDNRDGQYNPWNRMSPNYGNLLTGNQSNFETDTSGWTGTDCTLLQILTDHIYGSACMQMTSTSATNITAGTSYIACSPGNQLSFQAGMKAASAVTRTCSAYIYWRDSGGTVITSSAAATH